MKPFCGVIAREWTLLINEATENPSLKSSKVIDISGTLAIVMNLFILFSLFALSCAKNLVLNDSNFDKVVNDAEFLILLYSFTFNLTAIQTTAPLVLLSSLSLKSSRLKVPKPFLNLMWLKWIWKVIQVLAFVIYSSVFSIHADLYSICGSVRFS